MAQKEVQLRITLTGRPGKYEKYRGLIVTTLRQDLPSRISPEDERDSILYTVYIDFAQWVKVANKLRNQRTQLSIEGVCAYDPETDSMAVYTTKLTPIVPQRSNRPPRGRSTGFRGQMRGGRESFYHGSDRGSSYISFGDEQRAPRRQEPTTPPPRPVPKIKVEPDVEIPEGMPKEMADKLRQLHIAAAKFRKRIAELEEQPEDQRRGLDMTRKMLANTERQIKMIERKFS